MIAKFKKDNENLRRKVDIPMKVLTVIIPSYNTEKYIDECLPTLLKGGTDDVEILLVNDGSSDNTLQKIRKYESKYSNIIRVIDKENGGHGSVINVGITEARGKYFKVIDGDDWVDPNTFSRLIKDLRNTDVDLVLNSYITHNVINNRDKIIRQKGIRPSKEFLFDDIANRIGYLALHGITYKTSIFRDNKIKMQENCFYEDAEYDIYPVIHIQSMIYYDYPVYVYRIGSLTQSVNSSNVVKNKKMLNTIVNNLVNFFSNIPDDISHEKNEYIKKQISDVIKNMYGVYLKMPIGEEAFNEMHNFDQWLKSHSDILYASTNTLSVRMLRLNFYSLYVVGCKLFELMRKKRGF